MITWLKRGLLCLILLSLVTFAVLYFWSVAIVEAYLLPKLEARGGELDIEAIHMRLSGVEVELERYEEAAVVVKGLTVSCPWSQLWSMRSGLGGQVAIAEIRLRMEPGAEVRKDVASETYAGKVAALAQQIDALPLRGVEVVVGDLFIEKEGQVFRYGAELSMLRGGGGETHIAATLDGTSIDLDMRVKVLSGGEGLALDFVGSADYWATFQETYLGALSSQLTDARAELYLNPLAEGRGFLEVSGYARWQARQSDKLSFTILADLGASELYLPNGELTMLGASAGLTGDGTGTVRAYAKGAMEALRLGSWMESGGDWAFRLDGSKLAAEVRLGEGLSLSLGHDDWQEALAGAGVARIYLEAAGIDAELLRALSIQGVPDDLDVDMDLKLEGWGTLKGFALEVASVKADVHVREATLLEKGLSVKGLQAHSNVGLRAEVFRLNTLQLKATETTLLGFSMRDLEFAAEGAEDGTFSTQPVRAGFMGGTLQVEGMTVNPAKLDDLSFRARVDAVELAQLSAAVPQFKGEITGTVSGHLVGGWRHGQPLLTDGRLEVDSTDGARLMYNVDGMLTRGLPEGSAAYKQYRMAEKAFADLALKRFRIDVFPEGNQTRPFRLELFGESDQDGTVVPVDFDLNVNVDDTAGLMEILQLMRQGQLELN